MSESPFNPAEPIGVTIKFGKGHEDTWVTIRGTEPVVREQLISVFKLDSEESAELALFELVFNATQAAQKLNAVNRGLGGGGQVISDRGSRRGGNKDAWKDAEKPAEEKDPHEAAVEKALKEIEEAASVKDVQRWWAENQEIFKDERVATAWKARGKALSAEEAEKKRAAEAAQ